MVPSWDQLHSVLSYDKPSFCLYSISTRTHYSVLHPALAWHRNEFGKSNVCFKQVAVGIYGPAAPTTLASFKVR